MRNVKSLIAGLLMLGFSQQMAAAAEVTGKVVAVYHEPVQINAPNTPPKWADKVSVTVDNCATPGQFVTASYTPGSVSDDNALGFLFRDLANAARTNITKNQYLTMVSGHVTLNVNDQRVIQKTTFWGYNWECGRNVSGGGGAVGSAAPSASPASQPAPQSGKPKVGIPSLGRFGF